ncbi:adenylyltransferase/sulfurtransferase [Caldalkalibacillus uzonensis]|uniref:Adenylyltransferase/sulfurtransferase n=1 Tax=Caldalkalibacillus uzonensis TaxID=353224 RepID=A0ABU0CXM1_9BACI|nr:ThiF family adenylyltransferase [Caldalkalibacillus uzonensis]MDQ0340382.1 adenylyltransferase/sulfurtransferase [Caldalkalibacillus uzonensis]
MYTVKSRLKEQASLKNKKAAIIGVGALGSVTAQHLLRLGIGELRLIDRDIVELTNLGRQVLYTEADAHSRLPKAIAAQKRLQAINSSVRISAHVQDANPATIEELVKGCDLILDGTDNMRTRFLINDVSVKLNIPWIYGGAVASRGVVACFLPGRTPCLRCMFHEPDELHGQTCDTIGVLGPLVHIVGSYQVLLAYHLLTGNEEACLSSLKHIDLWHHDVDELPRVFHPSCPCCQKGKYHFLDENIQESLIVQLCGRNSIQITPQQPVHLSFDVWMKRWKQLGEAKQTAYYVQLYYDGYRIVVFRDGRLLLEGVNNPEQAKQLYAKLIGA